MCFTTINTKGKRVGEEGSEEGGREGSEEGGREGSEEGGRVIHVDAIWSLAG